MSNLLVITAVILTVMFMATAYLQAEQDDQRAETGNTPPFEYFKIIETNNLFRPLGWQHRPAEVPFTLIGIVGAEGERKAFLVGKDKNSYYVSKGDKVEKAEVIDILADHVVLSYEGGRIEIRFGKQARIGTAGATRSERQRSTSEKPDMSAARQDRMPPEVAGKIEANREELNRRTERWRSTGKVTRRMFYEFLSSRGVQPHEIFRDSDLRERMQDEFHMEMMEKEDSGEF